MEPDPVSFGRMLYPLGIGIKLWNRIKLSKNLNIPDANNGTVNTSGKINLAVKIGNKVEIVTFKSLSD